MAKTKGNGKKGESKSSEENKSSEFSWKRVLLMTVGTYFLFSLIFHGITLYLEYKTEEIRREGLSKDTPANLVALGMQAEKDENFEGAIEAYTTALTRFDDSDPFTPEIYSSRCFCRLELEHFKEAITDCSRAIRARKEHGHSLSANDFVWRGMAYADIKLNTQAENDFNSALSLEPDNETAKEALKLLIEGPPSCTKKKEQDAQSAADTIVPPQQA